MYKVVLKALVGQVKTVYVAMSSYSTPYIYLFFDTLYRTLVSSKIHYRR